jgi:hypothetical protein
MTLISLPGGASVELPISQLAYGDITVHRHKAPSRIIERWQKPNFLAILASYTPELQEVENALWDLLTSRYIDNATYAQLDLLGNLVGEAREGRVDAIYRVAVKARIAVNNSLGRTPDIIRVLRVLEPTIDVDLQDQGRASLKVEFLEPWAGDVDTTLEMVREAKAAGVSIQAVLPTSVNSITVTDLERPFPDSFPFEYLDAPLHGFGHTTPTEGVGGTAADGRLL